MTLTKLEQLLGNIRGKKIAVVGDVILDHYIWGDVGRISPEAPVPLVDVSEENYRLGGAANVALNLKALGLASLLFGRTGEDSGGRQLRGMLSEAGIEWLGDEVSPASRTIVKSRIVARNQQLCRLDREGRRAEYSLEQGDWERIVENLVAEADAILVSDYAKGVIDDNFLSVLRSRTAVSGKAVYCDPKPRFSRDFRDLQLLTPNRGEALQMSGVEWDAKDTFPAEEVVGKIHELYGPRYLVITLGAEGMLYAEDGSVGGLVPTFAREVYDVSGAGDTVIAVLSAALLAGASLAESVSVANLAAGVVVGKLGTATVTRDEIFSYAQRHGMLPEE